MNYAVVAKAISAFYAVCALFPRQNKITFLSRQSKNGSLDFKLLSEAVTKNSPDVLVRICATDPESVDKKALVLSLPSMLFHVATSRVCVLEGYIPAVSIPNLRRGTCVIQLWHALGAIKKFGFQSVGTTAGRSIEVAQTLSMHRNYDWIIAGGPGAIPSFAEAFGYGEEQIKPIGMPRVDYLLSKRGQSERLERAEILKSKHLFLKDDRYRILYVPTLRQNKDKEGWLAEEAVKLSDAFADTDVLLVVAGHPLDPSTGNEACSSLPNVAFVPGVRSIDLIELCDCVVTDYSAIAFEAAILDKPVWFYVPDIEEYRASPGLNIDPMKEFPQGSFSNPAALSEAIRSSLHAEVLLKESALPPTAAFADYASKYLADITEGCTDRLAAFIEKCYLDTFRDENGKRTGCSPND